jgi:nuclear cap-binding protein subunit 1
MTYRAADMDESEKHPKRVFVKRVMDLEIRLSYFDRIKNTVPGSMLDAGVFPEEAPGPDYVYEEPGLSRSHTGHVSIPY